VHLPTVKCHIYTTTTGAMKNAFGGLLTHKRPSYPPQIHETLVDLLAIQREIHAGLFCLMDGSMAGDGTGPRIMKPRQKDVILASEDQVAVDAVRRRLMGFDPMAIRYIALAHEAGLGVGRPDEIEIVGDLAPPRRTGTSRSAAASTSSPPGSPGSDPRASSRSSSRARRSSTRQLLLVLLPRRRALALPREARLRALAEDNEWGRLFDSYTTFRAATRRGQGTRERSGGGQERTPSHDERAS